jgi:peptidoglycan/xylan/chitin deacetylase (PgdA/CDA1 family)
MSLRDLRSPSRPLMFGYLLVALLLAALAVFMPISGVETGTRTALTDDALITSSTQADAPQCEAAHSLAGRELPVDPTGGPRFGTVQFPESLPLNDKEVVLTFDDGPHPTRTPEILDTLDRYCVKAVFFIVGEMAIEHPDVLRDVARRGHVIGTHTYTHPFNLPRMDKDSQAREIDGGFAAVAHVLGGPIAPIFRFPGLAHDHGLLADMSRRNISVWSVDVITGDSWFSAAHLASRLFSRLAEKGRGIVLMHDIKKQTADSLPGILEKLKAKGYTIPRVTVAPTLMPEEQLLASFDASKPRLQPGLLHRAPQRSGSARVATRSAVRPQRARPDVPEFQEQ